MYCFVLHMRQLALEEKYKHALLCIFLHSSFFMWQLKYSTQIKDPRQTHSIVIAHICEELQTPTRPFIVEIYIN